VKLYSLKTVNWLCLVSLLAVFSPMNSSACAACYGESDAPIALGAAWGIVVLGAIIACVLSGVVVFFVHSNRKASELKNVTDPAESV
jgi:hypothetical protein